ncbi:hypothetical protein NE237_016424 [Protea cynaroides]|uniref:Serpin domain-containing protein n=1 Tax=Protea cynaroides TaxID=273540 RepID=A0A9Q0HF00_9MAGN|nr:hypothetical protein NE237_016424 [Protea cynaroides]
MKGSKRNLRQTVKSLMLVALMVMIHLGSHGFAICEGMNSSVKLMEDEEELGRWRIHFDTPSYVVLEFCNYVKAQMGTEVVIAEEELADPELGERLGEDCDALPEGAVELSAVAIVGSDIMLKHKYCWKNKRFFGFKIHALSVADVHNVFGGEKAVEVVNEVNSWVEKETSGLIKEVLPLKSVHSSTKLVFANALYFKGTWNQKFDASKTKDYDFHLLEGGSVHVPFMTSKEDQFVCAYDGFKVLKLPYRQGEDKRRFSMYFFLLDAKDRLPALVEKCFFGGEKAVEVVNEVNSWVEKETSGLIKEVLPPGSVDSSTKLVFANALYFNGNWNEKFDASKTKDYDFYLLDGESLYYIHISPTPYSQGEDKRRFSMYFFLPDTEDRLPALVEKVASKPRFSRSRTFVCNIFHKSYMEVNEEGTEAAAVTAAMMYLCAFDDDDDDDEIDFVADHPFMYLIKEDTTGVVLFIGKILNPLQAA